MACRHSSVVTPSVPALCASVELGGGFVCASGLEHPPDCLVISALFTIDLDRGVCFIALTAFKDVEWRSRLGFVGCFFRFCCMAFNITALGALKDGIDLLEFKFAFRAEFQSTLP